MNINQSGETNVTAILGIIIIIAAGIGFSVMANRPQPEPTPMPMQNNNMMMDMSMVSVQAALLERENSGQSGTVTITDENGKTKVSINITPGPKDLPQPANIHSGDCTGLGSLKYMLNDIVNGKSETILTPSLHFIHGQGETSLHIGKSKTLSSVHVVCGDLLPSFNQAMGN